MLVDHACILRSLKLETISSQKTSCQTLKFCMSDTSFRATGGFIKLFHYIPLFFHDYSVFFKFHDFSMHGTFGGDFQGFTELVGTCHKSSPCHFVTGQVKGH